ncbi:diguanylate cyclase [Granulicatella balaenopterae]
MSFDSKKYRELTRQLVAIRDTADSNIKNCLVMMNNIADGKCDYIPNELGEDNDYQVVFERYTALLQSIEKINESINNLKIIINNGNLSSRIDLEGLNGIWLESVSNVNDIMKKFNQHQADLIRVLLAVSQGDLSQKIELEAKGEILLMKNTVNNLVEQLDSFTSEIIAVTKEVGIKGKFGVQVENEDLEGVWLDLRNNINMMSLSLEDVAIKNQNRIWIKEGISLLSQELLHKDVLAEQFQTAITQMCRYVKAGMGAIYIYDVNTDTLSVEAAFVRSMENAPSFRLGEGIVGQVAIDRKPILVENAAYQEVVQAGTTTYQIGSTYTLPLVFKDNLVGVVEVATFNRFSDCQLRYLEHALEVLSGSFYATIIQMKNRKELEQLSHTDGLTGLFNRGYFDVVLPEILNNQKRADSLMCFAMLDIDYFKSFNDRYGHQVGDEVLREVAHILMSTLQRDEDYCFRIGGEEFALIFSARNQEKARKFMDTLRMKIAQLNVFGDEKKNITNQVTVSMGLTCKRALEILNATTLYEETDKLLYQAKKSGRNQIVQNYQPLKEIPLQITDKIMD